ncbi:cytochrome c oxidase assembly protein [Roseobacter sp. HKCCA0434]|uniref:cytochrome c oxidase assembly protein n=1 Tax=Roseobacter sp. HKCCA0434 TaxID=3079297 RepID=UPI002905B942|nr:cytochrome c oxidase assembly protein [Roseobacter sp. HKCCA0434]
MTFWDTLDRLYCGPAPLPDALAGAWNLDPALLAGLALLAFALRGSRAGLVGVAVLVLAFVSPLCALSSALFSARVVHHVLLVAVAAPLLAQAWPGRAARGPTVPLLVATATLWAWHLPAAYDAALSNVAVYWGMQLSLLVTSVWFWRAALHFDTPPVHATLAILGAWMQMGLLGALLTFAPDALYAAHQSAPLAWGLSPLADQQLGGLLMWVPAGLPYALFGARAGLAAWRRTAPA